MSETTPEVPAAVPLLAPAQGVPDVIETSEKFESALDQLRKGDGPFAVDAERASGYKYSARAYLIQIKRTNGGLHLIDPIAFGPGHELFVKLNDLLNTDEVILHASTQDLPCLREVGLNPSRLFDTELGGRIAGLPRVGLGPLLESLMGVTLAKEHSAVDWSTRPLPKEWLNYAALDVELLIELRQKIYELLNASNKWKWAEAEFESILIAPPAPPRIDPWRRTSGMHKIKKRDQLVVIKNLWHARDEIARAADVSSGKLLNDAAIIEFAIHKPLNKKDAEKALRPIGMRARWLENMSTWLSATEAALNTPEDQWPPMKSGADTLPPLKLWRERFAEKYAPLTHARFAVESVAQELSIPAENLISPEIIRRLCWAPPADSLQNLNVDAVCEAMLNLGARQWQVEVVGPLVAAALLEREPREVPVLEAPDAAE
ncbi:MAG: ribonuclease D [Candidatus Planktophila sp.]|jgi:ribonuclease D|nr:ribonuclease D [Candidatus Planktophila sp.]